MTLPIRPEDYGDPNWCPDCGEPRGVCRCPEMSFHDWIEDHFDFCEEYESDDNDYCDLCGGEGVIITCCDDICVGGGHCIHGDGEEVCPECLGGY